VNVVIDDIERAATAAGFHVPMPEGYEEKLVERLKRRDEAAFNELIRLYQGRIFRLVFRMLGDRSEAEDLAQEVFITVFKSIDGFRGDSKLSTWLYRVATNHCKNRIKYLDRRARGKKKEFDEIAEHGAIESASMDPTTHIARPDQMLEAMQKERILQLAIAALDDEHRELIVFRDIEHMTYEQIQEITGLPEGTVKSRLHRARHALREHVRRLSEGRRSSHPNLPVAAEAED
jgi:RNA polymerase sigma-70 factor (ECF subfamily)